MFSKDRFHIRQELFDGGWSAPFSREVFTGAVQAAIVLLFDPHQDKVVLTQQFRSGPFGDGRRSFHAIELVAGHVDPGETPSRRAA